MKKILIRAAKHPFDAASAAATLKQNTIATNVGNLIFSNAVFKHLKTADTEVEVNGPRLNGDPADAEAINERYDAFAIPLANAFRPSFMRHLDTLTRLVERLDIPVVVVGVGAQTDVHYDLDAVSGLNEQVRRFITAVLDRSASIGVRGEFTADYLRRLGFNDVEVIGCPSMYTHGPGFRIPGPTGTLDPETSVALSYTPWADDEGTAAALVESALREHSRVTYFPQESKDLSLLYWGDTSQLTGTSAEAPVHLTHPLMRPGRTVFPLDPRTWIRELAEHDFAFGTRLHGNVAALLAGVPAMLLAHDSRTLELARYLGLPHRRLSEVEGGTTVADLYEQVDTGDFNRGYDKRFEAYSAFLSKNGLDNCFAHGDGGAAFEAEMARTVFPPPVRPWAESADPETATRIAWLKERVDNAGQRTGKLSGRLNAMEIAQADNTRRLLDVEDRLEDMTKRVARLERAWPQRLAKRVRRILRRRQRPNKERS
ncbi:polysaccharide pyruvyl transferase family protein [Glycomyces xiaoerkulensis]|uniref:polysaccharide pyruvyl transferase family protein n=1 Tax=Glycomyces xiaoerkulensis TaxID=2038139 RepID=UPI0018E46050|nr:polysaccharide pyruvyl transferase family protein [Glycomyces xiaoerkulensis]